MQAAVEPQADRRPARQPAAVAEPSSSRACAPGSPSSTASSAIRTLARRVAVVLALAAGIVGVVLAIERQGRERDQERGHRAARSGQVRRHQEASQAAEDDSPTLSDRIDALESRVSTIASSQRTTDSEIEVAQDDIDELRSDDHRPPERRSTRSNAAPPTPRQRRQRQLRHRRPRLCAIARSSLLRPTTGLRSRDPAPKGEARCLRVTALRNVRRSKSRIPSRSR